MKTKTQVFPENWYFKKSSFWHFHSGFLETFILDYCEKTQTENQQLFGGIIDVTSFDGVKGLNYCDKFLSYSIDLMKILPLHSYGGL